MLFRSIVGRITRDIDVRDYGSGVTGATNVIRTSGLKAGIVVIVGAVGFALWYANQRPAYSPALEQAVEEVRQKSSSNRSSRDDSWGIVHDSPLRRR